MTSPSNKQVTAPPMSWKQPRDPGQTAAALGDAQTNIRYGWLTALESKDATSKETKDLCRRSQTTATLKSRGQQPKQMRGVSLPPTPSAGQPVQEPGSMPPGANLPQLQGQQFSGPVLDPELIERTKYIVYFVGITVGELDGRLNSIILGNSPSQVPMATATNCSLILGRADHNWREISRQFWGIHELPQLTLPGPATLAGARTAIAELIQILLVEGALLFGRAEFEPMDHVRHLVEACISIHAQLGEIEMALTPAA